jgi:hypothetical protein
MKATYLLLSRFFIILICKLALVGALAGQSPGARQEKSYDTPNRSKTAACPVEVDAGEDRYFCNQNPVTLQLSGDVQGLPRVFNWEGLPLNQKNPFVTVDKTTTFKLYAWALDSSINLIQNPDFEQGNTAFTSDYKYSPGDLKLPSRYDVLQKPIDANPLYPACGDHTTGSGLMLANSPSTTDQVLWSQNVPIESDTKYFISGWATRFLSKGYLRLYVNGQLIVGYVPPMNCVWGRFSGFWDSGSNINALVTIIQPLPLLGLPGALAIDDLFMAPLCKVEDSMTVHLTSVQAVVAPPPSLHACENHAITLSGTGSSTGPFVTYQWTTPDGNIVSGDNTLNPVVDAPGSYTLTVTLDDGNYTNCSSTATVVTVEAVNQLTTWITTTQTLNCVQKQMTLLAGAGPGGNLSYQWTAGNGGNILSGATSKNAQINAPGTYTLLVTDLATGCTSVAERDVEADTIPPVVVANGNPITCLQPASVLSGLGSASGIGIFYDWTTPDGNIVAGQDSIIALADTAGMYVLKVTNAANFCTATDTVLVTANTIPPLAEIGPAGAVSCLMPLVVLTAAEDTSNIHRTYLWTTVEGNIVSGANTPGPTVNAPGWYTLLLTDTLSGCVATDSVQIEADLDAIVAVANTPGALNCVSEAVQLNANGSTNDPALTYLWTTADGNIVSGANSATPTVDQPGTYQLWLSNPDNGCTATDFAVVVLNNTPPSVSVAAAAPFTCVVTQQFLQGQNDAPSGNFSYQWTASAGGNILSGQNTLQPAIDAPGTYTLLTTDLTNGCTAEVSVSAGEDLAPPEIGIAPPQTLNCILTTLVLQAHNAASGNFSYQWTASAGGNILSGANTLEPVIDAPGAYTLLATNTANGCTATAQSTVSRYDPVEATLAEQSDATCFGAADGMLSVAALGGNGAYTYLWDNGATTPTVGNLIAGAYTVVVTDGTGCTAEVSGTIGQPPVVVPNATSTAPTVQGGNDGTATANPDGGTPPYTFKWNGGSTEQTIAGLSAGFYTVTVTDANGCTAEQTVEIFGGACDLAADLAGMNPACHGGSDGSATAMPLGGVGPFTFQWSNDATEETAQGLVAGNYTVVVTDANGCQFTASTTLNEPPLLSIIPIAVVNASCPGIPDGVAEVLSAGGTGSISVSWNNGEQGPIAVALPAGIHTATATDENGCTATLSVTIMATDLEPPVVLGGPVTLPLGPAGVISLTLQNLGVTATDNCTLDDAEIVPGSFDCLQIGTHPVTITVFDVAGNSADLTIPVTIIDNLPPQVECPQNVLRCADNRTVQYLAPVATDNCLMLGGFFDLVQGLPSGSQFPVGATVTEYTFTDASGNVGSCSFTVTVLTPIAVTLNAIVHDIAGQSVGSVQVSVGGSQPGYTYEWQRNGQTVSTTEDLIGVGAGAYTLLVTDAAGCTSTAGPFVVDDLVGTDTPDWADLVAVYPNPTSGAMYVVLPADLAGSSLRFVVFDATGRRVWEQNSDWQKQVPLDWSPLAEGLYTLLIRTERGQAAYKIVLANK